jgi:hypothetical protein
MCIIFKKWLRWLLNQLKRINFWKQYKISLNEWSNKLIKYFKSKIAKNYRLKLSKFSIMIFLDYF